MLKRSAAMDSESKEGVRKSGLRADIAIKVGDFILSRSTVLRGGDVLVFVEPLFAKSLMG